MRSHLKADKRAAYSNLQVETDASSDLESKYKPDNNESLKIIWESSQRELELLWRNWRGEREGGIYRIQKVENAKKKKKVAFCFLITDIDFVNQLGGSTQARAQHASRVALIGSVQGTGLIMAELTDPGSGVAPAYCGPKPCAVWMNFPGLCLVWALFRRPA